MTESNVIEEVLEFIWTQREEGSDSIKRLLATEEIIDAGAGAETLGEMERDSLIKMSGDSVRLTPGGEKAAESIIRRHRLAERLLVDVLDIEKDTVEKHACSFEHSISALVADSICALLGHPPACPHGHVIPRGECCKKTSAMISPLVVPLSELSTGVRARIVFIAPRTFSRIEKLGSLGLVPGCLIKLEQKKPVFVIKTGETTLALDPEMVKDIYVRKSG
ncbi:MAG: metal-dependent transcriptional regulator [Deltaproteobacteria bacterium]|nr:metal-dependent transcriptional regulator [Deltaproteobacteria bacterium]